MLLKLTVSKSVLLGDCISHSFRFGRQWPLRRRYQEGAQGRLEGGQRRSVLEGILKWKALVLKWVFITFRQGCARAFPLSYTISAISV